jgi:Flp pilus assembly protein TadG
MKSGWFKRGWRDETAAVAPTVALALFALIGAGGLAFDYARMVALDTELQNAADQAALAAASQLDGQSGAQTRAQNAAGLASLTGALAKNIALFANDPDAAGINVEIASVAFCSAFDDAVGPTADACTAATSDADAKTAWVKVKPREAFYALTPVIDLMSSGALAGEAVAALGTAICKVPPVMICNPNEATGDTSFNGDLLKGVGLRLLTVGSSGSWAPGNFGYLDTNGGSNGAPGLREALGWGTPPGECIAQSGVDTKPGATVTVTDAFNTRFDIYDNGQSCPSGGACPASVNSTKDVVRKSSGGANSCALGPQGWQQAGTTNAIVYLPDTVQTLAAQGMANPKVMGYPRDICHAAPSGATGFCSTAMGTGTWDRGAYFGVNYDWTSAQWPSFTNTALNPLPSNPTRYEVYSWEIAHRGETVGGKTILGSTGRGSGVGSGANQLLDYDAAVCSSGEGYGTGVVPGGSNIDRRRISIAVVNCVANGVNGNATDVPVQQWVDVFLVEPSVNRVRTSAGDIYVEVIGNSMAGAAGGTAGQVVRRDVPYLIR